MFSKKVLCIFYLFFCLPLLGLIYISFTTQWHYPALTSDVMTLHYWLSFLGGDSYELFYGLMTSLIIGIISSTCAVCLVFIIGYWIFKGLHDQIWINISYIPLSISPIVLGVFLRYYVLKAGLVGTYSAVILGHLLVMIPYGLIIYGNFWTKDLKRMITEAEQLGGKAYQIISQILWPISKKWISVIWGLCFVYSWFDYGLAYALGIGKVKTMPILLMNWIKEANLAIAGQASIILISPLLMIILIILMHYKIKKSI